MTAARGTQKPSSFLRCFLRSTAGGITVSFAMASPVLLAASGLAIDYATLEMKKAELQAVADVSAIGGAKELAVAGTSDDAIRAVIASYVAMEFSEAGASVTSTADIDRKEGTIRTEVEEHWTPTFAQFLNADITPIRARATALIVGSTNVCVLALDGSSTKAIHLDKSARMRANGCGVYSNSTHSEGIRLDKDSNMSAALICSAGGYKAKASAVEPIPTTDCPLIPDPLADRGIPAVGSCDQTGLALAAGNHTLSPGTYCGGIKIKGTASVNFLPGTYIISDGKFTVADTAKIAGEHVGFYLSGDASTIDFTDDASINLSGEVKGELAGLLFFEDRAASLNRKHHIQSIHVDELTGTIYLSRGTLLVDPNSPVAENSAYTAIIANRLELTEGPELTLNSDYGSTDVPVPAGIQSSVQVVLSE
jgi:Flp pilus assembly protein TadG